MSCRAGSRRRLPGWSGCARRTAWRMAALEGLDDDHVPAAARAWRVGIGRFDGRLIDGRRCDREQLAGAFETGLASASGEEAIVADAVEAVGQHVDQETADELAGGQTHNLLAVAMLERKHPP